MDTTMTTHTTPAIEATAVLTLKASRHVARQALEDAVFHVERILGEHVADIALGASACADFEHDTIEIDIFLTGHSPTELHRHLASVIDTLEQHCALDINDGSDGHLALASSVTRVAQPHPIAA